MPTVTVYQVLGLTLAATSVTSATSLRVLAAASAMPTATAYQGARAQPRSFSSRGTPTARPATARQAPVYAALGSAAQCRLLLGLPGAHLFASLRAALASARVAPHHAALPALSLPQPTAAAPASRA
ncbi:hypothetical protein OEZ86_008087 [Tetradesmus obliquus]|nr:hypothetical protein OEZ86_008087 [Tetradesmus obliquus]